MVPFLLGSNPFQLLRPAAAGLAAGWAGQMSTIESREVPATPETTDSQGMNYLDSLRRRLVTLYLPLAAFLFVLLFPFYWMAITYVQAEQRIAVARRQSFLGDQPNARTHQEAAVRHGVPGLAVEHDGGVGRVNGAVALLQRTGSLCDRAAAVPRIALRWHEHLPGVSGAAVDPVHPAGSDRLQVPALRHPSRADPDVSDLPDPVLHLAADGLLPLDSVRARGVRTDRWRQPRCRSS